MAAPMPDAPASTVAEARSASSRSRRRRWASLSWRVKTGVVIVGVVILMAVIGPSIAPYDPSAVSGAILQPPSWSHLLGTTQTGQDVLSQMLVGARTSVVVGLVAGSVATFIGVVIGMAAGFLGGTSDDLLSVFTNVFIVIPALPLLIMITAYIKNAGDLVIALVIALIGWAFTARLIRAQTLSLRNRDFILAARASGEGTPRLLFSEVLPNVGAIIASGFLFSVIFAILTQASLAFLGLGNPSEWSWGTILYWAQNNEALSVGAWWWFVPPGVCIALLGAALSMINFGIDELINPRLRTRPRSRRTRRDQADEAERLLPATGDDFVTTTGLADPDGAPT